MQNGPEIGTAKQLFIDEMIIKEMRGVMRTLNQPAKYAGNPLMFPLYPWEGRLELYGTVHRDSVDGLMRMWYTGLGRMGITPLGKENKSRWAHIGFDPSELLYSCCYATSRDGVFWERPNLGLVEFEGSRDNNIAIANAAGGNVCFDDQLADPERRYKALFFESRDADGTSNEGDGVSVAFSPDGIRWAKYEGNPVIQRASDSHTMFGWDECHRTYVAYCRPSLKEGNTVRRIGRCTSTDFLHWSDPEEVLEPDNRDPEGMQFYCMPTFQYEGHYIGQLHAYHALPEEPSIQFYGKIDIQLTVSRDGVQWDRVCDRAEFMANGPPGSDDAGEIYMANAPIEVGDELWFYYSPCSVEHGPTGRSGPINLAKLRRDGFVSVDAGDEMGTLLTQPFRCAGGELRINAQARGGMIAVAVIDEQGRQYDQFGKVHSALFDGDAVDHVMTWQRASFDDLKGKIVRLKFYLRNGRLYSFKQE